MKILAVLVILLASACSAGPPHGDGRPEGPPTSAPEAQVVGEAADPRPERQPGRQPGRQPASEGWREGRRADGGQVEAYASAVSGVPGTEVALMVSTASERFRVEAWRIGWYGEASGLRVWRSLALPGKVQAGPSFASHETRTVVARWSPSVTVDTAGWRPGFYVFKVVTRNHWNALVPYVVSSESAEGRVALVVPFTTYQAYNVWGGYSLYEGKDGDRRAWAVSFDRPWLGVGGANSWRTNAVPAIIQAERLGVPTAYFANLDLHFRPRALDRAAAYFSLGHDEYWTPEMRAQVRRARDAGTNLAFLGANTMYWRVRFEGRRLMVGYRSDAWADPVRESDPVRATSRFRDAPHARAEHDLIGMQYECYPVDTAYRVVSPGWWGFRGTGVRYGDELAHLVGPEADRVYPDAALPRPLQILSDNSYSCRGVTTSTQSVYYTTPSGAGVFAAGTLRWVCALARSCDVPIDAATQAFAHTVTRNVLREFAAGPAGARHPARDNVDRFSLPLVNGVDAS